MIFMLLGWRRGNREQVAYTRRRSNHGVSTTQIGKCMPGTAQSDAVTAAYVSGDTESPCVDETEFFQV